MTDTLFADVSSWQPPVDDSYPYQVLSFRSNDGTFQDSNFAHNYAWASRAADDGRLACIIVYAYCRADIRTAWTMIDMVRAAGGPHSKMIAMLDVESGGNPVGDGSPWINGIYHELAAWLGDARRVIGYANASDFETLWRTRPDGLRVIGAGYGSNPNLPGQIAHQYTDGSGYGGGLPEGAPPFGNCDMNSADGLSAVEFAAECGITSGGWPMALTDTQQQQLYDAVMDIQTQLRGPDLQGWSQLGTDAQGNKRTLVDGVAAIKDDLEAGK